MDSSRFIKIQKYSQISLHKRQKFEYVRKPLALDLNIVKTMKITHGIITFLIDRMFIIRIFLTIYNEKVLNAF